MSRFEHYELKAKWAHASALVYGRRCRLEVAKAQLAYDLFYENDDPPFSLSIWPLGKAADAAIVGAGEVYFEHADGQNRWRKLEPIPLKDLSRQQAAWTEEPIDLDVSPFGAPEESNHWYLVSSSAVPVGLYFGALVKPDAVPSTLPEGLTTARAQLAGNKAHPRAIVGRVLARARAFDAVRVELDAEHTNETRKLLARALPKATLGLVVVPDYAQTQVEPSPRADAPRANVAPGSVAGWTERLSARFGPLHREGDALHSPALNGDIHIIARDAVGDVLETWFATPSFTFGDRPADATHWDATDVSVAELEIETIDGDRAERTIGLIRCSDGGLSIALRGLGGRDLLASLGITPEPTSTLRRAALGHG